MLSCKAFDSTTERAMSAAPSPYPNPYITCQCNAVRKTNSLKVGNVNNHITKSPMDENPNKVMLDKMKNVLLFNFIDYNEAIGVGS